MREMENFGGRGRQKRVKVEAINNQYGGMVCSLCVHEKIGSLWQKRYSSMLD
jgi:hypothetical protein